MRTLETQTCHRHTYPFLPPPLDIRLPDAHQVSVRGCFPPLVSSLRMGSMPSRCPLAFVLQAPAVGRAWDPMTSMTFLFHQHWPGLFPGWPWPTWQKSRLLLGTRASTRRSGALHLESGDWQVAKDTQRRTGRAGTGIPSRDNQHLLFPQLRTFQGPSATGARELGPHRQHHSSGDTKRPGGLQVPPLQPGPPFSASQPLTVSFSPSTISNGEHVGASYLHSSPPLQS